LPVCTILGRADEHLYKVVVQSVEELALEAPFELRVIQIAGVQVKVVRMNRDLLVLEADDA
jgi:hypothetical protein